MIRSTSRLVVLWLTAAATLIGDVTVRYSYEMKPGAMIPPAAAEQMRQQMKELLPESGLYLQLKGNRAYSTGFGMTSISDFDGAMITVVDTKSKKYATAETAAYLRSVVERQEAVKKRMPAEAQKAMEQMKTSTEVRKTGRTKTIHGIAATETEMILTMEMPGTPVGPMRSVMSFWSPEKSEVDSRPALRELRFFAQRAFEGTNPATTLDRAFGQAPGMGSSMKQMMEEFKDSAVVLEMRVSSYAPGLAAAMTKAGDEQKAALADAPLMEMIMELQELSTADVPASVFDIPRDYTAVPMAELLTGAMPKPGL
jgi:hypothetical protein